MNFHVILFFHSIGNDQWVAFPRMVSERAPAYKPVGNQNYSIVLGYIPQVRHTYAYYDADYGLINEMQVMIAETTTAAKTVGFPKHMLNFFLSDIFVSLIKFINSF